MDVRILACVVPLAPFILVGTLMFAGLFTHSLSPSMYLGIAGYCIGLLGIAGIVMASMESTYSDARKARIAILLLLCGIAAAAIGAIVLMSSRTTSWWR
ncbi:hypothetical protein [Microbulbifer guangxiensis]|uniref:hypothetical protein n=1 Tax=Microbulbifer guangxiensis TaxID=2904249 RepID=UPI001F1FFFED|nr:hypothetical protein [Microbulbifer guangxiensis]